MHSHLHLAKGFSGVPTQNLPSELFCVHCSHSLGAMRNAAQRRKTEARHLCPEKLLSRQPAAPPPYN